MQTQQYKHWYYYCPYGTTSLASEVLNPFFLPYFSNYFHCFSSIMLVILIYFFLLPQIGMAQPSYDMTGICHTITTHMLRSGITGNIFLSVPSCFIYIISGNFFSLYDDGYSLSGVWFNIGIGTNQNISWQPDPTSPYPSISITI